MTQPLRSLLRRFFPPPSYPRLSGKHVAIALILVGLVGASAASFRGAEGRRLPVPGGPSIRRAACPLSRDQERTAMDAFQKLVPVVLHPRCLNCHGGVNPYVDQSVGKHLGGDIPRAFDSHGIPKHCPECHELPGWDLPPEPFFFIGKDASDLCIQFKKFHPRKEFFVGHVLNENGRGPQFTASAFKGDRALNDMAKDLYTEETGRPFVTQPPPGTHEQFVADAQAWVDAMGAGWAVPPDCGCRPFGSAWVGTVNSGLEMRSPELGTLTETMKATVRFVIDSSFDITDDPAEYWKSVSGKIEWETSNVGGQCRVGASGSLPIGLGGDLNPMGMLRGERGNTQGMIFSVSIGPWPDAHDPVIIWQCPGYTIPARLLSLGVWWHYDIPTGLISLDGKTLKGNYRTASGSRSSYWEWDLHLVP